MKQVININFQGRVIPIETTAFEILKNYTESLNRHFAGEEGKEEIINDIENRIAELFQERLKKGATCITDEDVNAIIANMGRPEDLDDLMDEPGSQNQQQSTQSENTTQSTVHKRLFRDENNKVFGGVCSGIANYFNTDPVIIRILTVLFFGAAFLPYIILWIALPSSASVKIGSLRKRLYRDTDDKIVAGVCSGIANYLGINAWIPRVIFLIPFLSFVFHWNHWFFGDFPGFFHFSFSPGSLLIYIILWAVFPEAKSTAEKLEMKGEKVDLNSIKNSVMEEMKEIKQKAEKWGEEAKEFAEENKRKFQNEFHAHSKTGIRSLGDFIVAVLKIFGYIIIGFVTVISLIVLFALAIAAIGVFPLKNLIISGYWENLYAWGTLLFFIGVPILGVIIFIIRRLARIKGNHKLLTYSFISLWVIGWACFIFLLASVSKEFSYSNDMNPQVISIPNPKVTKLEFTSPDEIVKYNKRKRIISLNMNSIFGTNGEDTLYLNNVHFRITKSPNDSFQISIIKLADGKSRKEAEELASEINYQMTQEDSLVRMPYGISFSKGNIFRNQHVIVTVAVPVGKRIKINQSIWNAPTGKVNFSFNNDDWNDYWGDEEHGWTTDQEYIMNPDGLYDLNGEPADKSKNGYQQKKKNQKLHIHKTQETNDEDI